MVTVCMQFIFITSPAAAYETQVVESGHLVLDGGRGITELGWVVLIISRHYRHKGAIRHVTQGNHLMIGEENGLWKFEFHELCNWTSCLWVVALLYFYNLIG